MSTTLTILLLAISLCVIDAQSSLTMSSRLEYSIIGESVCGDVSGDLTQGVCVGANSAGDVELVGGVTVDTMKERCAADMRCQSLSFSSDTVASPIAIQNNTFQTAKPGFHYRKQALSSRLNLATVGLPVCGRGVGEPGFGVCVDSNELGQIVGDDDVMQARCLADPRCVYLSFDQTSYVPRSRHTLVDGIAGFHYIKHEFDYYTTAATGDLLCGTDERNFRGICANATGAGWIAQTPDLTADVLLTRCLGEEYCHGFSYTSVADGQAAFVPLSSVSGRSTQQGFAYRKIISPTQRLDTLNEESSASRVGFALAILLSIVMLAF